MTERSDNELVLAYRKGDEGAFETLVLRYLGPLYRFAFRFIRDRAAAEDIVQESFVKAWARLNRYNVEKPFKTWIYAITRNTAIDAVRKKDPISFSALEKEELGDEGDARGFEVEDPRPLANAWLAKEEMLAEITAAIGHLPPKQRAVVLLHDEEELTFREIAEATKEPLNTVKSRYRRAVEQLKTELCKEKNDHSCTK